MTSHALHLALEQWLAARLQYFRRKAISPVTGPVPAIPSSGDHASVPDGAWEGVEVTWGALGSRAKPLQLQLADAKASVADQPWRVVRLGDTVELSREEPGAPRVMKLLLLEGELVGTWQEGDRVGEVYLVHAEAGRCARQQFSELSQLVALLAIALALALAPWPIWGRLLWWWAVASPVLMLGYVYQNVRQLRAWHLSRWEMLWREIRRSDIAEAAGRAFGGSSR